MRLNQRQVLVALAPGLALGLWLVLVAALLWSTLSQPERDGLAAADRAVEHLPVGGPPRVVDEDARARARVLRAGAGLELA